MFSWFLSVLWVTLVVVSARPRGSNEISKRQANATCGNLDFRNTSGFISTPNYPNNYDNRMDCIYTIQPANLSSFSVNFHACDCIVEASSSCAWDWIRFNATNSTGTKFCGDLSGRDFSAHSFNGKVEVFFHSDEIVTERGCNLGYTVNGAPPVCPNNGNYTTPSWNYTTPSWNYTTPSWNYTTPSWNYTTPSWNYTTSWFNYTTTPSWNYTTSIPSNITVAPSNGSIFDLLNIMYTKQFALENAFLEYRFAISNVINRLMN